MLWLHSVGTAHLAYQMLKGLGVTGSRTVIGVCLLLSGTVGFFLQAQSNLSPKSTRLAASASE